MTAAHCVRGATPEQLNLQYGSNTIARNASQLASVASIHVHPGYEPQDKYIHDIALLQLTKPLLLTDSVQPIRLPDSNQQTLEHTNATLAGWGLNAVRYRFLQIMMFLLLIVYILQTGGVVQQQLMKVELQIFSDEECSRLHETHLHASQICAGVPEGGKGQCSGDSGGPLLLTGTDTQIGIVSWSIKPCTRPPYPGVFTEVSAYVDWIVKTVGASAHSQLWIGQLIVARVPPPLNP